MVKKKGKRRQKQRLCRICKKRPVWRGGDAQNPGPHCKRCYHKHIWPEWLDVESDRHEERRELESVYDTVVRQFMESCGGWLAAGVKAGLCSEKGQPTRKGRELGFASRMGRRSLRWALTKLAEIGLLTDTR